MQHHGLRFALLALLAAPAAAYACYCDPPPTDQAFARATLVVEGHVVEAGPVTPATMDNFIDGNPQPIVLTITAVYKSPSDAVAVESRLPVTYHHCNDAAVHTGETDEIWFLEGKDGAWRVHACDLRLPASPAFRADVSALQRP